MFTAHRYADILTVVEDRVSGCKGAKETQLPVKVHIGNGTHFPLPVAEFESRQFPPEFLSNIHDQLLSDSHLNCINLQTQNINFIEFDTKGLLPS